MEASSNTKPVTISRDKPLFLRVSQINIGVNERKGGLIIFFFCAEVNKIGLPSPLKILIQTIMKAHHELQTETLNLGKWLMRYLFPNGFEI